MKEEFHPHNAELLQERHLSSVPFPCDSDKVEPYECLGFRLAQYLPRPAIGDMQVMREAFAC